MIVYHGSYTEISQIDISKCEPHRDFGQGFYVTKFRQHAESWAKRKSRFKHKGFISEYEFYYSELVSRKCKTKQFVTYNEEWLDFVVLNRNDKNPTPSHDYDIVEGPVADDKVQNRIIDYLNGDITKTVFLEELRWHEETHQICFCTVASLQFLKQLNSSKLVSKFLHIGEPIVEKLVTDFGFDETTATDKFFSSKTFSKLADTSNQLYKKEWTEVYNLLMNELKM
ncbi:MAG: DUF3990 domain-containing protein [Prevotellaceae bacterium]|jgi:hypothetical protein|nr:DUF3990 domain-containing protein [Prevotellaceae bacterium]